MNNLAFLHQELKEYDRSEELYVEALRIKETTFGPEHPSTAMSINNLASLYQASGRSEDAEVYYQRSLAISKKIFGNERPRVAKVLENYARMLQEVGQQERSLEMTTEAKTIRAKFSSYEPA